MLEALTPIILGQARHLLTAAGGYVFAKSCDIASFCVSADTQGVLVGAALIAVGAVWSAFAKKAVA